MDGDDAPVAVPHLFENEVREFRETLERGGLQPALRLLNGRTPHRFTGVFRFDGDMLRNVVLVDKWEPEVVRGADVPLAQAYCAHLHRSGGAVEVRDGAADARFPWMQQSPIVSYCGAVILDDDGGHWGALCHFDMSRCESKKSDLPLLEAAAGLIYRLASAASGGA